MTDDKTVLHVGCGSREDGKLNHYYIDNGYKELRLDIDSSVEPDIVGSILDMRVIETASMSAIFSSHNLEHLFAHEVSLAINEFVRVLKPDGFAMVIVPDLQSVCAMVADDRLNEAVYQSQVGPIYPLDILYGYSEAIRGGKHFMAHKTGFTASTLTEKLLSGGFGSVDVLRKSNTLYACAYMPRCEMRLSIA